MSLPTKPSRAYEDAGGDRMTREQALRHFGNRSLKLKEEIRALPLAEKFRLVADFLELPAGSVVPTLVLSLARLALAELEARP